MGEGTTPAPRARTLFVVRPAEPDDAVSLAATHRRAWHEAYDDLMTPELIDEPPVVELEQRWRTILEVDEPDGVVAVGVAPDGEILGFASAGPPRDEDSPVDWELYAINLLRTAYGTGLAHDLVAAVTKTRPNVLWVLVENDRARAFYAKEGYLDEGGRTVHEASGLPEMRLVRR